MNLFEKHDLQSLTEEAIEILGKAKERIRPVATFLLFSGGNDSTTLFELMHPYVDAAVHIVTGIGIVDRGRTALDHVQRQCERRGVRLIVLMTAPSVYRGLVLDGNGFPGDHRITYHHLKQVRLKELQDGHSFRGEKILLVSGIRRKESKRRQLRYENRKELDSDHGARRCFYVTPLLNFDALDMASVREHYETEQCEGSAFIHKSGECLCSAYPQPFTLDELHFWFPETGDYIRGLEREAKQREKPYCRWGQPHSPTKPVPGPLCSECSLFSEAV